MNRGALSQQQLCSRHRRLVLRRTDVAGVVQSHVRRAQDGHRNKPNGTQTQPKQIQLLFKQIFNQCPEAGNQLQFKPTLEKLPVYYRTHVLGWDFSGQLVCISSLLLLRAGLCHNIIFHTLIPLAAHPSFFIIASNKY